MLRATFKKYQLQFKDPVLTSRGAMNVKNGYYLYINDGQYTGVGECSFIEGLSVDDLPNYERTLSKLCRYVEGQTGAPVPDLDNFPSLKFGLEVASCDLKYKGSKVLFDSKFTRGEDQIPINGLVWMGNKDFMLQQVKQKMSEGFNCIKIKVGAINFEEEVMLLEFIRSRFPADVMEIRLDANGAFDGDTVFEKLDALNKFGIHSIEQPIQPGQFELLQQVCANSPIPIALDEELINYGLQDKDELLSVINPAYIILKPSLLGGLFICSDWIESAKKHSIGWWATSALESNIGLNAIAQWVYARSNGMVQGLGTGGLYTNNISSPLFIEKGHLGYNPQGTWGSI